MRSCVVWGFLAGLPPWTRAGLFGLVYFAGAELGNVLSFQPGNVATFWPPAGLFVAVLLLSDLRTWPAFLLAAFPANIAFDLLHGRPLWASVLFTVGNGLEALVGAWLVRRFVGERPALASAKEVLGLALLSAGLSTTLGATIGSATVLAAYGGDSLWRIWRVWWSGDALGVLVFAPVILTWVAGREAGGEPHAPSGLREFTLLLVGMTAGAWCVFSNVSMGHRFDYLVIPFLLWAALRFGPRGTATAGLVLALVAAWSSTRGSNGVPPGGMHLADHILWLQAFLGVALLTALTLAAVLEERKRAEAALAEHTRQLEGVRAVTAEITRELDLTVLLDLIHRRAAGLVGAVSGAVFLWDEAAQSLIPHAAHGFGEWRWDLPFRLGEGVVGVAAQRREGLMVNDYRASPYMHPLVLDRTAITAVMAEPLLYQERLLGGIAVSHQEPGRRFTERDRETLVLFATQAAIAIENARLHEAAVRRTEQMESLLRATHSVMSELDLQEILDRIVAEATHLLGAEASAIRLREGEALVLQARTETAAFLSRTSLKVGESLTGRVVATGEPVVVEDLLEDARYDPTHKRATAEQGFHGFLGVPLRVEDRVIGALTVYCKARRRFPPEEIALLSGLGDQASLAIENARLYEAEQERRRQLEAVRAVTAEITQELDLSTLLMLIHRHATKLLGAGEGTVFLWDEADQVLVPRVWQGDGDQTRELRLKLGEGVAGTAAQRREGLVVNDFRTSPYITPMLLARTTHIGVVAEPLLYRGRLLGVVSVDNTDPGRRFTEQDREMLALLAAQAAIAIENARLHEATANRAKQLATLIDLTRALTTVLEPQAVAQKILMAAQVLIPGAAGRLWEQDQREGMLCLVATVGLKEPAGGARVRFPLGEGVSGIAANTRQPVICEDVTCDPRFVNKAWAKAEGLTACIVLPLIYRERVMGVLAMFTRGAHVFSSEEVQLLRSFADHAAIALENARLYEEVQRHAGDLEVRVQERTRDLEEAVRQAEAASAAKSDFLANMSHELRTPLNSVIGFSELLQGLSFGPLSERQARFVTNIHTSGKHLLDIVTDILDLTKVEAGKLTLRYESFEVEPVLEEVVTLVREVAVKKSQALTVNIAPGLPPLSADPMRFRQICFNLLSNAVKFTAPGGAVRVTARQICDFRLPICDLKSGDSEPQSQTANPKSEILPSPPQSAIRNRQSAIESSWLELSVADTGMGIKPEDMPRLFQEFVQLEPAMTKHQEGTGLGLALAKRLVELHGGRIWATSPGEGQGSTFTVLLPFEGPVGRKQEAGGS